MAQRAKGAFGPSGIGADSTPVGFPEPTGQAPVRSSDLRGRRGKHGAEDRKRKA